MNLLGYGLRQGRRFVSTAKTISVIVSGNEIAAEYIGGIIGVAAVDQTVVGQTIVAQHAARVALAAQGKAGTSIQLSDASHDIESLTSGSITGQGATLFNTYLVPTIQAMTAAGYDHVFVPTIIERSWTGSATDIDEKEVERLAYNQLIRDNADTYGYSTADFSALSPEINRPAGIIPDTVGGNVMATFFGGLIDYSTSSVIPLNGYEAIYAKANGWISADNSNYLVTAGSAIQQMTDRSGYERHGTQSNASSQAELISGNASFDGADHIKIPISSDWGYFLVSLSGDMSKTSLIFGCRDFYSDKFLCIIQNHSTGTELYRGFTVPETYIDGVLFTGTTRDDLFDQIITDTPKTVLLKVTGGQHNLGILFDAAYGFGFKGLVKEVAFLPSGSPTNNLNRVSSAFANRMGGSWTNI